MYGLNAIFVNKTPRMVENAVASRVGKIISLGFALCKATRTAIMDEGKICKEVAFKTKNIAEEYLKESGATEIRKLREEYPYALYDIEYKVNGVKRYMIVRFTATNSKYFNLSYNKIRFSNDFNGQVYVCLITDVNGKAKINIYTIENINRMNKKLNSICYEDTEE